MWCTVAMLQMVGNTLLKSCGMYTLTSTEFLHDALPRAKEIFLKHKRRHVHDTFYSRNDKS
jgi:hypothetical protein